jgi:molybdopterin-guanine dinucleotide biosynthesis protein A/molybdopterin converting factor small subunit
MEAINDRLFAHGSAVILAGGKSSRMGSPKALLEFDNDPLIVHLARKLKSLFPDLVIVAAPGQELPALPGKLVRDEIAYQGPVGGIYYGLNASAGEFSFVTSCDVPFLSADLVAYLISLIEDHDVVAPYWQDRFQPLCAVYRRSVLPYLSEQLARGELRPIFLYDKVRTRRVGEEETRRFDPDGLSFFNMNSPEDYAEALSLWQKKRAMTCTVELFGVPRLLAKTKEVSLALPPSATLADVFSALAERLPMLSGRVIDRQKSVLSSGYACNVNGLKFVRDPAAAVRPGDRIFIVAADAGG